MRTWVGNDGEQCYGLMSHIRKQKTPLVPISGRSPESFRFIVQDFRPPKNRFTIGPLPTCIPNGKRGGYRNGMNADSGPLIHSRLSGWMACRLPTNKPFLRTFGRGSENIEPIVTTVLRLAVMYRIPVGQGWNRCVETSPSMECAKVREFWEQFKKQ
jgi:hypothetical protein